MATSTQKYYMKTDRNKVSSSRNGLKGETLKTLWVRNHMGKFTSVGKSLPPSRVEYYRERGEGNAKMN
ncbi:hypothetical protein K435DRAFT_179668 [Dendrothele bispora CBS 962.96]|uniref:Uncharacterized protein n=1 Tax=Dendrothele bispora (strain CBS 962.96) TaxID=1314807 RepID=A0A4S8LXN8_DENBC|nr:hypothetical protein K435DRAFT_179668 [Dendrothele bispora CBS 962.96]